MMPSVTALVQYLAVAVVSSQLVAAKAFEKLHRGIPDGWSYSRDAEPSTPIKLRIALKQQNLELFEETLLAVSDPRHERYGMHMQGHEVKAMLRPSQEATESVLEWLEDFDIADVEDDSDWMTFRTNVSNANALLDTQFGWYKRETTGKERLRALEYTVPSSVAPHINLVAPVTRFGTIDNHRSTVWENEVLDAEVNAVNSDVDAACNRTITPQCLLQLYNVHYQSKADSGNKVGYASYLEEYARYNDLKLFEQNIAPYAINQSFDVVLFNGAVNDQNSPADSGEANLDNQYIVGVGHPVPVTEFITAGRGPLVPDLDEPDPSDDENEPYLDYLMAILKLPNDKLPQTISHSYGEDEQSVPASFAYQVCNLFAQLGARGVSVLFSSGDSGVGSACQSNDGKNTTEFQPQFPATCPYVTSVGGTRYIEPEQATYFSSGGFSRLWSRPAYQELAVQSYLQQIGSKFAKYYNRNGRGFPDVAAQAYGFSVYDKGVLKHYQGTSCASPTVAAIIAQLNGARRSIGLPALGFLNPFIYTVGQKAFTDITRGGSTGCNGLSRFNGPPNGSPVIPYASFNATPGWDPVTGLGTPDFGKLLAIAAPGVKNQGGVVPAKSSKREVAFES